MAGLIDLQIQFRRAKKTSSDGTQSTHEVLATIDGSGSWRGESTIDYTQLAEAEQAPRQYGKRLGEVLFNPAIMNALRQARGLLIGQATDDFNHRWSVLAAELSMLVEEQEASGASEDMAAKLGNRWVARDDARNYLILGDPAVRLRVEAMS
jgi:hypothetical protein